MSVIPTTPSINWHYGDAYACAIPTGNYVWRRRDELRTNRSWADIALDEAVNAVKAFVGDESLSESDKAALAEAKLKVEAATAAVAKAEAALAEFEKEEADRNSDEFNVWD